MASRLRPYRAERFGILNKQGDVWTPDTFQTEAEAVAHIADFWRGTKDIDLSQFKVVRVKVVVSAISSQPPILPIEDAP